MSIIYTIQRILCTRDEWALCRVEYQGEDFVIGGTWPGKLVPGQRFRGTCRTTARGRNLDHITHVNVDENQFRSILHDNDMQRKQVDALMKPGMKRLKRALGSGDARALKRWKGVGKSTANKAIECYKLFQESFRFREPWFERYPTLEEHHKPAFDQLMRTEEIDHWSEPYAVLLKNHKFWGLTEFNDSTALNDLTALIQFATIIANDIGIDASNEFYQRFERSLACLRQIASTGSTWVPSVSSNSLGPDMEDPYVLDENQRCTVRRYQRAEEHIAKVLSRLTRVQNRLIHLREYVPNALDPDLDDTQREAVHMALTQPVSILCGGAGVGKSRTLTAIVDQLGSSVLVCAPTGKAAARLRELGINASTLHSAMFTQRPDRRCFCHLVLDEQSMQDVDVLSSLFHRCPILDSILFVGDPFQLPSVGPGALLRDLIRCKRIPVTRLTTIYRSEAASIVQNANLIRRGNTQLIEDNCFRVLPLSHNILIQQFIRMWNPSNPPVILAALNKTVAILNTRIHNHMQRTGKYVEVNFYGYAAPWPIYIGDRMMNIKNMLVAQSHTHEDDRNDDQIYVANGEIGIVTKIDTDTVTMEFAEGTIVIHNPKIQLRPCYAVTVHKSQGSEYDHVICVVEPSRLMHRRLLYTAITRAKKTCTIYEQPGALKNAIRKRAEERHTKLVEYINTCYSQTTTSPPPSSPPPAPSIDASPTPEIESNNTKKRSLPPLGPSTVKRRSC